MTMNDLDLGFYLKEEQKTALKFAVLPTGYGKSQLAPMIYIEWHSTLEC